MQGSKKYIVSGVKATIFNFILYVSYYVPKIREICVHFKLRIKLFNGIDSVKEKFQSVPLGSSVLLYENPKHRSRWEKLEEYLVLRDCNIREFIESKQLIFYRGCAFYEFTNATEDIEGKEVVLKGKFYMVLREKVSMDYVIHFCT